MYFTRLKISGGEGPLSGCCGKEILPRLTELKRTNEVGSRLLQQIWPQLWWAVNTLARSVWRRARGSPASVHYCAVVWGRARGSPARVHYCVVGARIACKRALLRWCVGTSSRIACENALFLCWIQEETVFPCQHLKAEGRHGVPRPRLGNSLNLCGRKMGMRALSMTRVRGVLVLQALWNRRQATRAVGRRSYSIYENFDVYSGTETGRVIINEYDDTGFSANGVRHEGSMICLGKLVFSWSPHSLAEITPQSLAIFQLLRPAPEILVVGCGKRLERSESRSPRVFEFEWHQNRSAASTFNILNEEGRQVGSDAAPPTDGIATDAEQQFQEMEISIANFVARCGVITLSSLLSTRTI